MRTEVSAATQRVLDSMPREIDAIIAQRTQEAMERSRQMAQPCACYECRRGRGA